MDAMTTAAEPVVSLMMRLREETRALHHEAESHRFQRALAQGALPREAYVGYLEQLLIVHRALDAGLVSLMESDARVSRVVSVEQLQAVYLREDLKFFGREERSISAGEGAVELLSEVARARTSRPIEQLGLHYVTLGSTNGGRYIARSVRRAYGLTAEGVRYLDPWGEDQTRIWHSFRREMDAAGFDPHECAVILHGAGVMFRGITRIAEGLAGAFGV
jgi:heme oxygenase